MCVCAFLKILTLEERGDQGVESQEERQGKMLLHTEYSLLSLLHTQDGVAHHHGLFQVSGRGGCLSPSPRPPLLAGSWGRPPLGPCLYLERLAHVTAWDPCMLGAPGLAGVWAGGQAVAAPAAAAPRPRGSPACGNAPFFGEPLFQEGRKT